MGEDYNNWHALRTGDDDVSAPWHNFVKASVSQQDFQDKAVLEIGCGRGGFANFILNTYPEIGELTACDFSDTALEMAKSKYPSERIVWKKEDIQRLTFPDKIFDTIISCETIEHVKNPYKALEELYRVLKPNGKLVLTCPNYFNPFGIWCLYRKIIGKPFTEGGQPYVNYLLVPLILRKVKSLGFRVEHYSSTEIILPAKKPKTFYNLGIPRMLKYFGYRTNFALRKGTS